MAIRNDKRASGSSNGPAETRFLICGERVAQTFRDCCAAGQRADIIQPEERSFTRAGFAHCCEDYLGLDLLEEAAASFTPHSTCMVTFFHDGRAFLCIGRVRDYVENPGSEPDRLMLEFPDHITTTQVRRTPRIPVSGEPELRVQLRGSGGRTWNPVAIDVSLGGMLVKFPIGEEPDLKTGQKLEARLSIEAKSVKFIAELRHFHGQRYGFYFPEVYRAGEFDPPETYRSMVMTMEQRWLQARRGD